MKAGLVDNGFGGDRKCIEIVAETDEERTALERLRLGYGALGCTVVAAGTNDAVQIDAFRIVHGMTDEGARTMTMTNDWEFPAGPPW